MHQCRNVDDTTDFVCDHPSHDAPPYVERDPVTHDLVPTAGPTAGHPPTWPGYIDDNRAVVQWRQPDVEPLPPAGKTDLGTALLALAHDIDNGAPAFCSLHVEPGVIEIQLAGNVDQPANMAAWARILGMTSVKVEHNWHSHGDKYTVESILCAGWRLRVWDAWKPAGHQQPSPISYVPVHTLEPRAFDDPPAVIA